MATVTWPKTLLVPANVKLSFQSTSRGGGQTVEGNEQVVVSPGSQRWAMSFSGLAIRTREQIRAIRAIEAQLDGRANTLVLPIYDQGRSIGAAGDPTTAFVDVAWDDDTTWDDDTLWTQPNPEEIVTVSADATINATSIAIVYQGYAPLPGQHFSIGTRLYRVRDFTATGTNAGTITLRPWLREAVAAGAAVNFADPVGLFRLVKDDGLALDLQFWRFASAQIDFVEA